MFKMECFVRNTDPFFQIATRAIAELRNQQRYEVVYERTSTIHHVKSASDENPLRFENLYGLARRLRVCARMCMAHSAGMNPRLRHDTNCFERNLEDPDNFTTELFVGDEQNLAADEQRQRKYCNEYDRLYSEHAMQDRVENGEGEINIPRVMYIFRNNWREVIEISTTMSIEDRGAQFENENGDGGRYKCRIQVVTIKARIAQPSEGAQDQTFMRLLIATADAHNHPNDNNLLDEIIPDLANLNL